MRHCDAAFPYVLDAEVYADGLSKREFVAAGVLVGLMAHACLPFCEGADRDPDHLAGLAVKYTDALLAALSK